MRIQGQTAIRLPHPAALPGAAAPASAPEPAAHPLPQQDAGGRATTFTSNSVAISCVWPTRACSKSPSTAPSPCCARRPATSCSSLPAMTSRRPWAVARDIYAELPTLPRRGRRSPSSPSRSRHASPLRRPYQPGHGGRKRATGGAPAGLHPPALPLMTFAEIRNCGQTCRPTSAPCCCGSSTEDRQPQSPGGPHQAVLPLAYDITPGSHPEWIRQTPTA